MTFIDVTPNHPVRSPLAHLVLAAVKWLGKTRAQRKHRAALQDLFFMPEHRLRDLGLRREDLLEAIERRRMHPGGPDHFN